MALGQVQLRCLPAQLHWSQRDCIMTEFGHWLRYVGWYFAIRHQFFKVVKSSFLFFLAEYLFDVFQIKEMNFCSTERMGFLLVEYFCTFYLLNLLWVLNSSVAWNGKSVALRPSELLQRSTALNILQALCSDLVFNILHFKG